MVDFLLAPRAPRRKPRVGRWRPPSGTTGACPWGRAIMRLWFGRVPPNRSVNFHSLGFCEAQQAQLQQVVQQINHLSEAAPLAAVRPSRRDAPAGAANAERGRRGAEAKDPPKVKEVTIQSKPRGAGRRTAQDVCLWRYSNVIYIRSNTYIYIYIL